MCDPAPRRIPLGRAFAFLALLTLVFPGSPLPARQASDPPERLTPEQRQERERAAGSASFSRAGVQSYQRGDLGPRLSRRSSQSLRLFERLYPKTDYPHGRPDLANSLNNLGYLLQAQGDYGGARGYLERALAMYQALYPKHGYPQGHPELARSLNNLGELLQDQGSYGEARKCYERALTMRLAMYPKDALPAGAPRPGREPE